MSIVHMKKVTALLSALVLACVLSLGSLTACSTPQQQNAKPAATQQTQSAQKASTKKVVDMAGRTVEIPSEVKSVATFGAVGVLNAFVECLGKGQLIKNEMPAHFTKTDKWFMQYKFAPQIKGAPVVENANGVNTEAVLALKPDVCITMQKDKLEQLEKAGQKVILIEWNNPEDVKQAVKLMGDVLGAKKQAAQYSAYFDKMVEKAKNLTAKLPQSERVSCLYGDLENLKNPHIISEWWLTAAGGNSVSKAKHTANALQFTMEDLLSWQPQVIFASVTNANKVLANPQFANIPAVKNKKVYNVPTVAHVWGNRTVEQPLTVLWSMHKMYPSLYSEADLSKDIKEFYATFFKYTMSADEINKIINYQ